jgi:diacylglycerol kinase (ATP)
VSPAEPVFVVANPRAGRGRGASLLQPVLQRLSGARKVEHAVTSAAREEAALAADAVRRGYRTIVALGGDGTWGNVADAIVRSGSGARLGLVAAGTGCDFAKTLGIPHRDLEGQLEVILAGHARCIDVGRVENRHFLNIAGFGYDVAVLEDSWKVTYLEGELVYLYCALRQLRCFPGFPLEMAADGGAPERRELLMLIVANARVFGGGFQIAPAARLDDGLLDAVAFDNMRVMQRLRTLRRLLKGTHQQGSEVRTARGRRFTLRFAEPPAYETDGEWNRARSSELVVEAVPEALDVLAPAEPLR